LKNIGLFLPAESAGLLGRDRLRIQRREQAGRLELGGAKGGVHRELRERVGSNILVRDSFQTISGMQPSLATPEGTNYWAQSGVPPAGRCPQASVAGMIEAENSM